MPRKLWHVKLLCPHPGCNQKELISAGLYPHTHWVLDMDAVITTLSQNTLSAGSTVWNNGNNWKFRTLSILISWSIKIPNWNKFNMAAMYDKKFTWFQVSEITPCLYITTRRKPTYHCWANAFKKEWSICGSFIVVRKLKHSNSLNRMRTCTLHFIVIVIIIIFVWDFSHT